MINEDFISSGQIRSFKEHCGNFLDFSSDDGNRNYSIPNIVIKFSSDSETIEKDFFETISYLIEKEEFYIKSLSEESKKRLLTIRPFFGSITEAIFRRVLINFFSFTNKENDVKARKKKIKTVENIIKNFEHYFDLTAKFEIKTSSGINTVIDYTKSFDLISQSFFLFSRNYSVVREESLSLLSTITELSRKENISEELVNRVYNFFTNNDNDQLNQDSRKVIKRAIEEEQNISFTKLGEIVKVYLSFKVDIPHQIRENPTKGDDIILKFRNYFKFSWHDIDKILSFSSEEKNNVIGQAFLQIAKTKAGILTVGIFDSMMIQYMEDYPDLDIAKLISCKDKWNNNILHCLADSLVEELESSSITVEKWANYKGIINDSKIWGVDLAREKNFWGKTPADILNSSSLDINTEVILLDL